MFKAQFVALPTVHYEVHYEPNHRDEFMKIHGNYLKYYRDALCVTIENLSTTLFVTTIESYAFRRGKV